MIRAMTRAARRPSRRPGRYILVVLAVLAACATPAPPPDTAEARVQQARAAQAELLKQSEDYARAGDWIRAEQYLALALEQGADSAHVTRRLVDACVRGQRYRAAASHAERELSRHPEDVRLRLIRAVLLLGLDDAASAARELEQLLAIEPEHVLAHFVLGSLQREQLRDPVSADQHFRAYLALAPRGAHAERARRGLLLPVPLADVARAPQPPASLLDVSTPSNEALAPSNDSPATDTALLGALPSPSGSLDATSTPPENAP